MNRPSLESIYMSFAKDLASRSTCIRLQVACVITTPDLEQVLAIGYNGNAKGFSNECDRPKEQGNCGCVHAEINALIKCSVKRIDKIAFCTAAPCIKCAKPMINSGFSKVYYNDPYKYTDGIDALLRAGIHAIELEDHAAYSAGQGCQESH